jgi:DNA replication initiation complex subunit (GINS family)
MEDPIDLMSLNKIAWKERMQTSQKVMLLPEDFYPKLRRFLEDLGKEAIKSLEKRNDYEKANNLSEDITRMRIKKIVSLASSGRSEETGPITRNLTREEKFVYKCIYKVLSDWREEILKTQGEEKHD